jgi:hypothetical protein
MLSNRPDRVLVWSSQLRAGDFPPVCAMTGEPAETWRMFRFKTVPARAQLAGALGLAGFHLIGPLVEEATMLRAKGPLPLTKASNRKLQLINWGFLGLIPVAVLTVIVAMIVNASGIHTGTTGGILLAIGLSAPIVGAIGVLYIAPRFGPSGVVMSPPRGYRDDLVELRRVHPRFVATVRRLQQARAAELQSARPATSAPLSPFPPGKFSY